jgi:hypothetical protein
MYTVRSSSSSMSSLPRAGKCFSSHSTTRTPTSAIEGSTITPDVLDYLLDSEKYADAVSDLVQAVREFFGRIEILFEEESA